MDRTERNFERLIRQDFGEWPDGAVLRVEVDSSKSNNVERDYFLCTLRDQSGVVLGKWEGVEKQKMYDPVPSFSISKVH